MLAAPAEAPTVGGWEAEVGSVGEGEDTECAKSHVAVKKGLPGRTWTSTCPGAQGWQSWHPAEGWGLRELCHVATPEVMRGSRVTFP